MTTFWGWSVAAAASIVVAAGAFAQATNASSKARADFPLAASKAGSPYEAVFLARCQYCHVEMGPGTVTLERRYEKDKALLANRTDLTVDYIRYVVRHGINAMPAITPGEISDAELDLVARYLTRNNAQTKKSPPKK